MLKDHSRLRYPVPNWRLHGFGGWSDGLVALLVIVVPVGRSTAAAAQSRGPLALIVHPSNPVLDLSLDDLRRLYLGTTAAFPNMARVVLVVSADDRLRFYQEALRMSEDRFKRHWIARVFAGEPGTPPEEIRDPGELVRYVARHPGAIAFIPANHVDASVRLLTIETRRPSDPRYPFP